MLTKKIKCRFKEPKFRTINDTHQVAGALDPAYLFSRRGGGARARGQRTVAGQSRREGLSVSGGSWRLHAPPASKPSHACYTVCILIKREPKLTPLEKVLEKTVDWVVNILFKLKHHLIGRRYFYNEDLENHQSRYLLIYLADNLPSQWVVSVISSWLLCLSRLRTFWKKLTVK